MQQPKYKLYTTDTDLIKQLFILFISLFSSSVLFAQQKVNIQDQINQHIFSYEEIYCLEDPAGKLTLQDVQSPEMASKFKPSWSSTPQNYKLKSAYWYKVTIGYPPETKKNWMLEFFDQTIDDITVYLPAGNKGYKVEQFGALKAFGNRQFQHKNFEVGLNMEPGQERTYYFRIKSHQTADVIIVLRSVN